MPLVELAHPLGIRAIIVDGRERFATRERFPLAHEIRIGMPLRLIIAPLFADAEHGSVLTYKFAPDELSGGEL